MKNMFMEEKALYQKVYVETAAGSGPSDLWRPFCICRERRSAGYCSHGIKRVGDHAIFHYCLSGRGCVRYQGKTCDVLPGQGFLGVIDEIDYFYPEDGTEDWCFLWFSYTGGNYKEMTRYMLKINGPVFSLSAEDVFLSKLNMLRRSSSVRLNVFQAASLVHELFGALKNKLDQDHFSTIPEPVRHTIHRIQTEQIMPRVAELAEELGVSREYLSRIFHRAMSCSLQSFLKECCDEKAKKLLVTTDLSVTEIARLCGYQSESSFIRMFREKNQISPEKFRIITLQSYLSNSGQEQKQ